MLIELSHAFACVGDFQQSGDILDDALADSARREERWCVAELLRMKGEMLLSADPPDSKHARKRSFFSPSIGRAGKAPCRGNSYGIESRAASP